MTKKTETNEERFWSKVEKTDWCWNWTAYKDRGGYGRLSMKINGKWKGCRAHRVSLWLVGRCELKLKSRRTGLVDHICRNRACVNPDHLRLVTAKINTTENSLNLSAVNKAKKKCIRGHPFTKENTHVSPRNQRYCKICKRASNNISRKKKNEIKAASEVGND